MIGPESATCLLIACVIYLRCLCDGGGRLPVGKSSAIFTQNVEVTRSVTDGQDQHFLGKISWIHLIQWWYEAASHFKSKSAVLETRIQLDFPAAGEYYVNGWCNAAILRKRDARSQRHVSGSWKQQLTRSCSLPNLVNSVNDTNNKM